MGMNERSVSGWSGTVETVAGPRCGGGGRDGSVVEVEAMVDALAGLDRDCDDGVRVDRIAALERLQAAAFAAQAAELVRFADSQEAEQRRLGVPARRVGVGVADQLALACRVSVRSPARTIREGSVCSLPIRS